MTVLATTSFAEFAVGDPIVDVFRDDISGPASLNSTAMGTHSGNETELSPECEYYEPPLTDVRIWIVSVFGSCVSCLSIAENLFVFFLFATRKCHRTSYNVYLMLLAFFDVFISLAYIMLMAVNVASDYLRSVHLVRLWMSYMIPMITISHIAMTTSSFLILAATIERYCITTNARMLPTVQRNRKAIAFMAILFGVINKGTMFFEFKITKIEACEGLMTEYELGPRDFVFGTPYHVVWRLWYRNIVTVFFPFFMLAYFNIKIVQALSHQQKQSCADLNNSLEQTKRKRTARAATRTMILVVCCYLISNIVNVIVTILEQWYKDSLVINDRLYAIALDFVSLATTLSCAFRVPIYLFCQAALRDEIVYTLKHWICCQPAYRSKLGQNNPNSQVPDSPENSCLITDFGLNGNVHFTKLNGSNTGRADLLQKRTKNNSGTFISHYDEDQQSSSSSMNQNEILGRILNGNNNETLL